MISDLLDSFDFDLQKAIIDNYQLKDGLYVRVSESIDYFIYKSPKKDNPNDIGLKDLDGNIIVNEYNWFAVRDYLCDLQSMNKYVANKKIHSNSFLAIFFKEKEYSDKLISYIKDHFEKLKNPLLEQKIKKDKDKIVQQLLEKVVDKKVEEIFNIDREKEIDSYYNKLISFFSKLEKALVLLDHSKTQKDKFYIKIFFDEDLKRYEEEAKIYYALKIYNKIDTIENINGEIFGLSDFNMWLNAKKPYLEHKTRGFSLPFMVKKDEIFQIKELFDFLKYQKNILETSATKHKNGIFLVKHSNNDQAEIVDFDIVVNSSELTKPFILKNYIFKSKEDEKIEDFYSLFKRVDDIFYIGSLENNLFGDVYSKLPQTLQNLVYLTRDAMIALKKGEIKPLLKVNRKFADDFIIYHLRQNKEERAKEALNLKLSLLKYEGDEMDIKKSLQNIEQKIEELEELTSEEFFILSGQIIKYLLEKSKKSDKKADMIEPFLRAGKSRKLKQEIETLFFTYKHEIRLNFKKFNNALALVESYEENEKVQKDKLLVGILSENIFYKKGDDV